MAENFDAQSSADAFKLELTTEDDGVELIRWVIESNGQKQVYSNDPYTSAWRRFILFMAGWLPIESQL